jgi:HK97 family phage portal protein
VGLLRYLRGDDVLEDSSSNGNDESRSLPPPKNQLPLWVSRRSFRDPSYWKLSPVDALAVADCWAAVRVLSDAVSSVPLHVYRKTETGRQRVTSEKLVDLLERPSPGVTEADLTSSLMCHLAVWGNAFLAKYRQDGEVVQLGLLHPDRIRPELEDGKLKWRYSPPKGPQQMLTEADVVHVKGLSTDSLNGLSAVSQAARVLGLSDSLVKHAMSFFESKTQRPAGVLRLGDPEQFPNADSKDRTTEQLQNEFKPHGILVVTGDMEYQDVAHKMDDSQFVEQRRLACQEIARVFPVPSHMLNAGSGGDSLTYSTVEQQSLDFVRFSLTPWLRRIELALSGDADLAFAKQYVKFETDALLRPDSAGRAAFYSAALDPVTGWLDVNEVRALEDLPPLPPGHPLLGRNQTVEQMLALARPQEVASNGSNQ